MSCVITSKLVLELSFILVGNSHAFNIITHYMCCSSTLTLIFLPPLERILCNGSFLYVTSVSKAIQDKMVFVKHLEKTVHLFHSYRRHQQHRDL